ncbi:MAG: hypothetical protein HY094_04990 [Candidatus Melainabacteria bacterium]|nr:hypothetical protein [Candidatus Melainabacteria bacterium]
MYISPASEKTSLGIGVLAALLGLGGLAFISSTQKMSERQEITELISRSDKNKDGRLSVEEATEVIYNEYGVNKDRFISSNKVRDISQQAKRMGELGFKDASQNIFYALSEIGRKQIERQEK